jgi:ribosomal-protein-alanine N-acetyltransferase
VTAATGRIGADALPRVGLVLSKGFDQAVTVTLLQWPWYVGSVAAFVVADNVFEPWRTLLSYGADFIWLTAALVGAMRLDRPDFRPTTGFILRLAGVYVIAAAVFVAGLVVLIAPGLYFGTRLWLAPVAVALEGKAVGQAIARSWNLTGRAFWQTFALFAIVFCLEVLAGALAIFAVRESPLLRLIPWRHAALNETVNTVHALVVYFIIAASVSCKLLWLSALAAWPEKPMAPLLVRPFHPKRRLEQALETIRLRLDPLGPEHALLLYEPLRSPQLYRYVSQPPPESEQALARRFKLLATGHSPDGSQVWMNWAVSTGDGRYVGMVQATVDGKTAVMGYDIFPAYWRQGYGKEACSAVIESALRDLGVTLVEAIVDVENQASIALLESLDFKRVWTGPSDDMPGHTDHRYERVLG